jgi:hypothetical protein
MFARSRPRKRPRSMDSAASSPRRGPAAPATAALVRRPIAAAARARRSRSPAGSEKDEGEGRARRRDRDSVRVRASPPRGPLCHERPLPQASPSPRRGCVHPRSLRIAWRCHRTLSHRRRGRSRSRSRSRSGSRRRCAREPRGEGGTRQDARGSAGRLHPRAAIGDPATTSRRARRPRTSADGTTTTTGTTERMT